MRIAAISDTHGQHDSLDIPKCDLLIHAGDGCAHGTEDDFMRLMGWLGAQEADHKIYVPGNHDLWVESNPDLAQQKGLYSDVSVLIGDLVELPGGMSLLGEPHTPEFSDWAFQSERWDGDRILWEKHPPADIVVCHGPPSGSRRAVVNRGGLDEGSRGLEAYIAKHGPKLVICGHIHEGRGLSVVGNTVVANVACLDECYQLVSRDPFVVDVVL